MSTAAVQKAVFPSISPFQEFDVGESHLTGNFLKVETGGESPGGTILSR
jgi:hypothetical protein